jgi:hypothetical protein
MEVAACSPGTFEMIGSHTRTFEGHTRQRGVAIGELSPLWTMPAWGVSIYSSPILEPFHDQVPVNVSRNDDDDDHDSCRCLLVTGLANNHIGVQTDHLAAPIMTPDFRQKEFNPHPRAPSGTLRGDDHLSVSA